MASDVGSSLISASLTNYMELSTTSVARGSLVVKALCYKQEGRARPDEVKF
jgi:hypothetical protein